MLKTQDKQVTKGVKGTQETGHKDYIISEASYADVSQIIDITNSKHIRLIGNKAEELGFLNETLTLEGYMKKVSKGCRYIVAKRQHPYHEVIGYVCIIEGLGKAVTDTITYMKRYAYAGRYRGYFKGLHIDTLVVKDGMTSRGVAQSLYEVIKKLGRGRPLTAFIATKPIKNMRSLGFHRKQGFTKIGKVVLSTRGLNPHLQGYDMCSELYAFTDREAKEAIKLARTRGRY